MVSSLDSQIVVSPLCVDGINMHRPPWQIDNVAIKPGSHIARVARVQISTPLSEKCLSRKGRGMFACSEGFATSAPRLRGEGLGCFSTLIILIVA